jgi:fimbrial chaperone protein
MFRRLVCASIVGLAAVTPLQARAQSLEVHPVSVELARGRSSATLELSNRSTVPVTVQVRGFAWSQQTEGADPLVASDVLVLSPPFVTMPAGQSQIVRLLVRQPAIDKEMSYRLLLDQIPLPTDTPGVRLVLHFSVPVFVEPASVAPAQIEWALDIDPHGDSTLVAVNRGGRRAQVEHLSWSVEGATPSRIPSNGSAYVLSGAQRHWPTNGIEKRLQNGSQVHLNVMIDGQVSDVIVPVVRSP